MLDQLQGFHIEPTNMCTLKCPRCARTTFNEKFKPKNWDNQNLNLNHLKNFLDINLSNLQIQLNGNYGDPIYYPDLLEMIKFFKSNQSRIVLHTNGSYKSQDWWQELVKLLDSNDIINFSLDGIPENFTKYRVNADWASIQQGIEVVVKSPVTVNWKYIIFSYNEDTIDEARHLSQHLGMDNFIINNSDRWENNDWLRPKKYVNINTEEIFSSVTHNGNRSEPITLWKEQNQRDISINPLCKQTNYMHFISAWGYYMPCCWVGDYRFYYKSDFYKNRDLYDISKTTISELLNNLQNYYATLERTKLEYCTFNCPKL